MTKTDSPGDDRVSRYWSAHFKAFAAPTFPTSEDPRITSFIHNSSAALPDGGSIVVRGG
jgi:hypothetical protein